MFFDTIDQALQIAQRTSCTILVMSPETELKLKNALTLTPSTETKTPTITTDQIREFASWANNKEVIERFFIIKPADTMNESAQNAFLKNFEEPKPHCHYILITEQPSALLPTILSRAQVFYRRRTNIVDSAPAASEKIINYAKRLISANGQELITIADELSKQKTRTREYTLDVIATVIELLYKSYFKTKNPKFLARLPQFITLYNNLKQNGHLKLHLVADLC